MKKQVAVICAAVLLLGGCARREIAPKQLPTETVELPSLGQPGKSTAAVVLGDIWAQYEPQERFSVYGGMVEHPVPDAPGDLDMELPEKWAAHLRFPVASLPAAHKGAAITHLLNGSLLTAVVMHVSDGEKLDALAGDWRQEIQHSHWQSPAPERLLLMQTGRQYLVMAMGSKEYVRTFRQKLMQAYPASQVVCEEAITS